MKKAKLFSLALLGLIGFGVSACGGSAPVTPSTADSSQEPAITSSEEQSSQQQPQESSNEPQVESSEESSQVPQDVLKIELVNPGEQLELKIDQRYSAGELWTVTKGEAKPTNAEKKVLATSSDESIVRIAESSATSNPTFEAVGIGECTVTVKLNKAVDQQVVIPVVVGDSFFDLALSVLHAEDDISEEMPESRDEPGGKISMLSYVDSYAVVRGSATKDAFYLEGKISNYVLDGTDEWTKVGVMAIDLEETFNNVRFFIDVPVRDAGYYKNIGTVECAANASWGWQRSVPDTSARHKDLCFANAMPKSSYTLGMLRDGLDYHIFIDGTYRFTWVLLASLGQDAVGENRAMSCAFWNFNGVSYDVTNYYYTQDSEKIQEKLDLISVRNEITSFDIKTVD